jgi:hypothetical protein
MTPISLLAIMADSGLPLGIHDWILQSCWWQARDINYRPRRSPTKPSNKIVICTHSMRLESKMNIRHSEILLDQQLRCNQNVPQRT